MGFGITELIIILTIVLLLFGYKRIPQLFSGLGESIVGFKKSMREAEELDRQLKDKDEDRA